LQALYVGNREHAFKDGSDRAAGIAMLYVIYATCMFLVGLLGFCFPELRNVEKTLPDHDAAV
jgi:hypothetical protein